MSELSPENRALVERLYACLQPPRLRYCPLTPTPRQQAFLMLTCPEAFYGGAAAGGKTVALLMDACQYADVPGYDALIVRRSLAELNLPGNLIDLSHQWLAGSKAHWKSDLNQWRFPGRGRSGAGGATLTFGYIADDGDILRYSGSSFSYLGFDELTHFPEHRYQRMRRVLRNAPDGRDAAPDGTTLADVPIRLRAASNPGGENHEWVKTRFVDPMTRADGVVFLAARLADNPHIDSDYKDRLLQLPTAERERLLNGDWNIPDDGELFQRSWFTLVEPHQVPDKTVKVRYWDLAATEPSTGNPDPDWTVGIRLELDPQGKLYYLTDIVRVRRAAGSVEEIVRATANRDGKQVAIVIEQEGGAAGKAIINHYISDVLRGFNVRADRPSGHKYVRAQPVAAAAENGLIRIVRGPHTVAFLDELSSFPHGRHDDCVDALAGAHDRVTKLPTRGFRSYVARGRLPTATEAHISRDRLHTAYGDPLQELAARLGARFYDNTKH